MLTSQTFSINLINASPKIFRPYGGPCPPTPLRHHWTQPGKAKRGALRERQPVQIAVAWCGRTFDPNTPVVQLHLAQTVVCRVAGLVDRRVSRCRSPVWSRPSTPRVSFQTSPACGNWSTDAVNITQDWTAAGHGFGNASPHGKGRIHENSNAADWCNGVGVDRKLQYDAGEEHRMMPVFAVFSCRRYNA